MKNNVTLSIVMMVVPQFPEKIVTKVLARNCRNCRLHFFVDNIRRLMSRLLFVTVLVVFYSDFSILFNFLVFEAIFLYGNGPPKINPAIFLSSLLM